MPKLSKEKLNEIKESKNYTLKDIADLTGIPQSIIAKIFGGFNKNPTIVSLQKIAKALDCGLDDFIEYEQEPISPFYMDRLTMKLVEILNERKDIRQLVSEAKSLSSEDVEILISITKRFAKI